MVNHTATRPQSAPLPTGRRHELDLLGMGIVLALVFLHTISIFSGQQMIVNTRHLFDTGLEAAATLDQGQVPATVFAQFQGSDKPLSSAAVTVTVTAKDSETGAGIAWNIVDQGTQYTLEKTGGQAIHVHVLDQGAAVTMLSSLIISFVVVWAMPLLMLIAGIAVQYSLRRRKVGEFVVNRLLRLLVPFLVGLVLTMPLQAYFAAKFRFPDYQETFWQFFPRFWDVSFDITAFPLCVRGVLQNLVPDGVMRVFDVSHLWFLFYLLVYTLLLLPLFLYLRSPKSSRLVERLAGFFSHSWAIYLLALPVALIEGALGTEWPSGWNRFIWPVLILYGFVFASDERFTQVLVRHRKSALVLGINAFLAYFGALGILTAVFQVQNPFADMGPVGIAARVIKGLASWFWVVAILGIATYRRERAAAKPRPEGKPSFWERAAAYAREAQVPFYVLHQLPIIVLGYYVVQWNTNALVKFLVICLASYAITFAVYDLIVRRIPGVRFLFGARASKRQPQ